MSKTDSLHYNLCVEGAKWLKKSPFGGYKYIAVEIVCAAAESPDVWGTNGSQSTMIEIKVSRPDFLHDKKKFSRQNELHALGNFRYYLCPEGIITENDIPENWGLLYWRDGLITQIVEAKYQKTYNIGELAILCSIMRREGIKPSVFNYRK